MASGSFAVASTNKYISVTLNWSSTPNTAGNYSNVYFELRASRTNTGYTTYGTGSGTVTINGTPVNFSISPSQKMTYNSNTLIASGTVTVYHNDDGAKTTSVSVYAHIPTISLTFGTTTSNITLDTIARKSSPTLNGTTFTITKASSNFMRIYTNRKATFTHSIYYSFNGSTEALIASNVATSYDWYFPDTLANNIPNAASGSGYIRLYTYNGSTNLGSNTVSFTMQVDSTFVPTATIELSDKMGFEEYYGRYIQKQSKLSGEIAASGCYGSSISKYKTTVEGYTFGSQTFETGYISSSGTLKVETIVTDSRGRTATIEEEIEVYAYEPPKISALKAVRCLEDGTTSNSGAFLKVIFDVEVVSLDEQNTCALDLEFKKKTEEEYGDQIGLYEYINQYSITEGYAIFPADVSSTYDIVLTVSDMFLVNSKKTTGASESVFMSKLWRGLGAAFGKLAELEGVFDIGWKTRFHGGFLHMVLEDKSDLNELFIPNKYVLKSGFSYSNAPEESINAMLEIEGDEDFLVQTLSIVGNGRSYKRYCIDGVWEEQWTNTLLYQYPIGSIYMSTSSTNPANSFGGTWIAWGSGRVPVGVNASDTDFSTVEKTGGSKSRQLSAAIGCVNGSPASLGFICDGVSQYQAGRAATYVSTGTQTSYSFWNHSIPVTEHGVNSRSTNILQPYITCYMWKRTA